MRNIPYFIPDITEAEKNAILNVLENPSHNIVLDLETEFKKYIGIKHAISAVSGTAAFHLCLFAMDLKRGDKILCPVNCHPMFPEMIRHFDAEPIFVDIEEDTFLISLQKCKETLEKTSNKKLRAIIISHTAGQACNVESFYDLAESYNIKIIEDATMALGLTQNGLKIGSHRSFASIFSIVLDSSNPVAQAVCSPHKMMRLPLLQCYFAITESQVSTLQARVRNIFMMSWGLATNTTLAFLILPFV